MQEVTFDTHAAIRKLEGAGCPAPQAEAMVAVVSQATAVTSRMDQMVTKGELYRALSIQGGILATLILLYGAMTLGIALYAFSGC